MTAPNGHSPLGGSGIYRWVPCPGSVQLSEGAEDPDSEYSALGTAAHTLAAYCLGHGTDAWEHTGMAVRPNVGLWRPDLIEARECHKVDKDMADAVQVYLDAVRETHGSYAGHGNWSWVERRFHCPTIHELFYGQSDFTAVESEEWTEGVLGDTLHVWDYKHGAGIVVDVVENWQCMYYAVGMLEELDLWFKVDRVVLHIVQPRGWHSSGPVREWSISVPDLWQWREGFLVPAMNRAMVSRDTASGEHCRFCPARFQACPQLSKDAKEMRRILAMTEKKGGTPHLTNEELGRLLELGVPMNIALKAARETGFVRAEKGQMIPGYKLVKAKSNREWKEGADGRARAEFGDDAFTPPALKSPAQIDKLPKGKAFATREAYKPDKGNQLVPEKDSRQEAGPSVKSMFKAKGA